MQVEQRSSFVERSEVLHYLTCWIADKRVFPKALTLGVAGFLSGYFFIAGWSNKKEEDEEGEVKEGEKSVFVNMPGSDTNPSRDLLEKPESNILHSVGEMIYQSLLGYEAVAASPEKDTETDATGSRYDNGGLKPDPAVVQELDAVGSTNLAADDASEQDNKSVIQSVGEIISYSAHTVKEAVLAHAHIDHDDNKEPLPNRREGDHQSWNKSVEEASVDDGVVTPSFGSQEAAAAVCEQQANQEDGDEKGIVQSVGEMIALSAQSVKEVLANGHIASVTGTLSLPFPPLMQ